MPGDTLDSVLADPILRSREEAHELASRCFPMMLKDRRSRESFCDWISWWTAQSARDSLIEQVTDILTGRVEFSADPARLYQWPKGCYSDVGAGQPAAWTYRRMIHLSNRDWLLRYCIFMQIHEHLAPQLAATSFANVRADDGSRILHEDYPEQIKNWRRWQEAEQRRYGDAVVAAVTDLSAFYDTIGHTELIQTIARLGGLKPNDPLLTVLANMLNPPLQRIEFRQEANSPLHQGLATGCTPDAVLANYYLTEIDNAMATLDGISYARYCDDVNILADSLEVVTQAMTSFFGAAQAKALAINSKKTGLRRGAAEVSQLLDKQQQSGYYYERHLPGEDNEELAPLEMACAFEDFGTVFDANDRDAVRAAPLDFCKFMAQSSRTKTLLPLYKRTTDHVERLTEIVLSSHRSAKWASWLLVQTGFSGGVIDEVRAAARTAILETLQDSATHDIPWIRIAHHLCAPREGSSWGKVLVHNGAANALQLAAENRLNHDRWPVRRTAEAMLEMTRRSESAAT